MRGNGQSIDALTEQQEHFVTKRGEPRMNRICKGKPSERAGRKVRRLRLNSYVGSAARISFFDLMFRIERKMKLWQIKI